MLNAYTMLALLDIVSSKRKAEVFRLLFGVNRQDYHLRELARRSGLALRTVQQELARLVKVGLVTARRDGNRVYYQANQENPVYGDLRNIVIKTAGLAGVLQQALQVPEIELVFVFGSVAAGKAEPRSDVDLLIIGTVGLRRVAQLLSGCSERLGREINPHVMTKEEFGRRKHGADHFVSSVLGSPRLFVIGSEDELAELGG